MQLSPHALPAVQILQQAGAATPGTSADRPVVCSIGRVLATRVVSDRSAVSMKVPSLFAKIEIVPSTSVRCTRAPTLCHCWMILGDGCP